MHIKLATLLWKDNLINNTEVRLQVLHANFTGYIY